MPESPAEKERSRRRRETPEYKAYQRDYQRNYQRKRRRKNLAEVQAYARLRNYGLTPEQFEVMMEAQEGQCAICTRFLTNPVVDHDHLTGDIRGLLCPKCNTALGMFEDSIANLMQAAHYLAPRLSFGVI